MRDMTLRRPWAARAAAGCLVLALAAAPAAGQTIAIVGGTAFPVSGPKIENATIVIRDGVISAIGAGLAVPPDATRIDAAGRWITPGLMHPSTGTGLNGVVAAVREGRVSGDLSAAFNVLEGIDPAAVQIPIARAGGVTAAVVVPSGGLIPGQAVAIRLAGDRVEDLVLRSPVAMRIDLSEGSREAGGGSRAGASARLRQVLRDAGVYARRRADYERAEMQPLAAPARDLEALQPLLRGEVPAYVAANRASDIRTALRIAGETGIRMVILGGAEAWRVGPALAQAGVAVAVDPYDNIPSFDGLGARPDNAALLRAAGVTVLLYESQAGGPRNLRFAAGHAVRNGMAWEEALRAITLAPAQAFGLGESHGALAMGRAADLVIWTGDPFEFATAAERVFIAGREAATQTRQTELLERYRTLPPRY